MPIRSFHAADGAEWQVWSVIPGARPGAERRTGFDRRSPDPVLRYSGPERRVTPDRRRVSAALPAELMGGWLTFEGPGERRRLTPIPPHWDELPESELERLRERAVPAPRLRPDS
jgi:hypothetical protein